MTPKKDIVRQPVYTLPDGSPVPSMGTEFTPKESRFIYWYTCPEFIKASVPGRAAARAGYKGNAVTQGYLLRQKPRIAGKIDSLLVPVREQLRDTLYRVIFLCRDRMFFDIMDFYRPCKRVVKRGGCETEVDSYEAVPLNQLTWAQRMCIDAVDIRTINGKDEWWYKLADRDKAFDLFFKCYKLVMPEKDTLEMDWKATAEMIREKGGSPVIAPRDGKPPKNAIEAL
jgi:hypothetical protein